MATKSNISKELQKELRQKKKQAYMKLVLPASASFINGCIPKPTVEIPAELATQVIDMAIFVDIWQLYFERDASIGDITAILKEVGMAKATGTVLTFTAIKIADGAVNEIGNFLGPVGWLAEGLLSSSISIAAGYMWIRFCEKFYLEYGKDFLDKADSEEIMNKVVEISRNSEFPQAA